MGQACRAARRYALAVYYYRLYLRLEPNAPERAYVELRLSEISGSSAGPPRRAGTAGARSVPPAPPPTPVAHAPAPEPGGRGKRILGLASAGVGVALAGTALWFGNAAAGAAADVSDAFAHGAAYDDALAERYRDGRRDERIAVVTGAAGAALLTAGTVLWILGTLEGSRDPEPARVAIGATPGGAQVTAGWRF